MVKQVDSELHRLEQLLRLAQKRLEWMRRSVLDPAALTAAEDLCSEALAAVVAYREDGN
jgi:hypothetical protein